MNDIIFKSTLTPQQIDKNFETKNAFTGIMSGLEEAVEYSQGKKRIETLVRKRSIPAIDVAQLRASLDMTQKRFSQMLGVSCRTVEAWECGRAVPSPTARKLMKLIGEDHTLIDRL